MIVCTCILHIIQMHIYMYMYMYFVSVYIYRTIFPVDDLIIETDGLFSDPQ